MDRRQLQRVVTAWAVSLAVVAPATLAATRATARSPSDTAAMADLLGYVQSQNTTGFLIVQNDKLVVEKNWPAPVGDRQFALLAYDHDEEGALLEDVESQQKSFVSLLCAVVADKGLLDVAKPVSAYIGTGWSKASAGHSDLRKSCDSR